MIAAEITKSSMQIQPVARSEQTQATARINRIQQGQEPAAISGQALPPEEQKSAAPKAGNETVQAAVSNIADYVQSVNRDLQFSVDDDSGRVIVKVTDSATKEVIRQIPTEQALDMARKLQENIGEESGGLLFQDNA